MWSRFDSALVRRLLVLTLLAGTAAAQDYPIFKWNQQRGDWDQAGGGGAASRIAVAPDGSPWVVNSFGQIFHLAGNSWRHVPGMAKDIAIGGDGSVWVIGGDPRILQDDGIFRLESDGGWTRIDGAALNISVSRNAQPFMVNTEGNIYTLRGTSFVKLEGSASDIAVSSKGPVWITGPNGEISFLNRGNTWTQVPGKAFRIAVGPDGNPWVVTLERTIYRWVKQDPPDPSQDPTGGSAEFQLVPGRANDVGIGSDGSIWVIGYSASGTGPTSQSGVPNRPPPPPQPKLPPQDITDVIVRTDLHKVTILFRTAQLTPTLVEMCTRRPDTDLKFDCRDLLTIEPVKNSQGTTHTVSMDGLPSGAHYYFVISVWDKSGQVVKSDGEFSTKIRID
jgi:hypothetical protein